TCGAYVILKKCQLTGQPCCGNLLVTMMTSPLEAIGRVALAQVQGMGRMTIFLGSACFWACLPPLKLRRIVRQIHFIGVKSVSVILLTALFTGMVLALQGYYTLRKFGSEALLGTAVALSLIRELGPVMAALMVTARAGSATAAEIGIMRITEQIDALTAMAVNPMKYLVVPRVIAGVIAVPLLTAIFDVVGIYGGYELRDHCDLGLHLQGLLHRAWRRRRGEVDDGGCGPLVGPGAGLGLFHDLPPVLNR
ncbi:MAG: yrbE, partial [candidate division NC10 bacterium]|nr:yrbE [candidate division NC10 bacterium]